MLKQLTVFTITLLLISFILSSSTLEADEITVQSQNSLKRQAIGEAPKEVKNHDLSRLFLRDSEVLLNPKELQLSIGFNYDTNENFASFRKNRSRGVSLPVGISYGITKKLEINGSLPLVYTENEIISASNVVDGEKFGVGDLSLGFSYKIKQETKTAPSITTSLNVSIPTGKTAKPNDINGLSTGTGFWGVSGGVSLAKSIDPAVVFFNVGYQHTFEKRQYGDLVQPGDTFNYGFGAGLSVNNSIAFSARISGSFQKETKLGKKQLLGTSSEPISLVGSLSYKLNNKARFETTLSMGLSDDANDVGMGFSYIWNL